MSYTANTYDAVLGGTFSHYGSSAFDKQRFNPVRNREGSINKPAGGLWSSPTGKERYRWVDFGWRINDADTDPHFYFRLKQGAKVLILREDEVINQKLLRFDREPICRTAYYSSTYPYMGPGATVTSVLSELLNTGDSELKLSWDSSKQSAWEAIGNHVDFEALAESYDAILYLVGESWVIDALCHYWDVDSLVILNPDSIEQVPR